MKAAVLTDLRKIEYKDIEMPNINSNDVLIKVVETGICGSDLMVYRGIHPYKKWPIVLGHEVCGVVDKVGKDVKNICVDDKVVVESYSPCESCEFCKEKRYNLCLNKKSAGYKDRQGSFAEFYIAPENSVYKIPDDLSFSEGVLIEPLAIALHALRLVSSISGKDITILGSGNIGLSCLVCAKKLGVKNVLCVDKSEYKKDLANKLGTDYFINNSKEDFSDSFKKYFKDGSDVTVVSGDYPNIMNDAAEITKNGGEIVIVSYFEDDLVLDLNKFARNEFSLKGSALSTKDDFSQVIDWLKNKEIKILPVISHRFPLEKAGEAMELMDQKISERGKIVLCNENA